MWMRTMMGVFMGLILMASTASALVVAMPSRQLGLLTGILSGFVICAGFQTWIYCAPNLKPVMRWSIPVLLGIAGLNALLMVGGLS